MLAANSGCSALHWGGKTSGERPGVRVAGPTLFSPAEIDVTSDTNAKLKLLKYGELEIHEAEFGQSASSVVREEPAKIRAIADLQMTQVEYARVTWNGVRDLAREIVPIFKLLAMANFIPTDSGMSLTLPNGFSIGQHTITSPQEMQAVFQQAAASLEAISESDMPTPASQPAP
jgi:hypothetical protein